MLAADCFRPAYDIVMGPRVNYTDPLGDDLELLLSVLPIFIEAADSLVKKQTTTERRRSCLRMHAFCKMVSGELGRIKPLVKPDTECVMKLLDVLNGLLPRPTYLEASNNRPDIGSNRPHQRLAALKSKCTPLKQSSSFQDEHSRSISSSIDFDDGQIEDLQHQLEAVYDFCLFDCPKESLMYVDEHTPPKRHRAEPAWAVWEAAQLTYRLLTSVKDCACDPSHPCDARLFLATHRDSKAQEGGCNLEMFLSLGSPWQEVRVSILDEPCMKVLINDEPATKPAKSNKQIKNLCKVMTKFRRTQIPNFHRLSLTVEGGSLWNNRSEDSPFPSKIPRREISLEDFIRTNPSTLTEMTKRIVAVMLGHGVLHLLSTGWIQQSWGASNVIFYQISSTIPIRPYIQVHLVADEVDASDDDEADFGNDDWFSHPFPGLVTLGMMLMQLYMGRTFESFAQEFGLGDPEQLNNNQKFSLAIAAFKEYASGILFSEQYYHAIDRCLDPGIQYNEDGEKMSHDGLRRVIYDEIVWPIEDELERGNFSTSGSSFILNLDTEAQNLDLANWGRRLNFHTSTQSDQSAVPLPKWPSPTMTNYGRQDQKKKVTQAIPDKVIGKSFRASTSSCSRRRIPGCTSKQMWLCGSPTSDFFDDESRQEHIGQKACDDFLSWKEDVLTVYHKFLKPSLESQPEPTKIAVLDTGLDLEHPDFVYNPERRQRIRIQRDFIGKKTSKGKDNRHILDESGHGTHIAGILLDLAPDSELYIAKIAAQGPSPNRLIAEAIKCAIDDWKVDIITMSFGFTTREIPDYDLVEKALEHANSNNVLLFAAASNSGANQRRTFPARHDYVICIHSTTANGVPSDFNPPHEDSNNFATIGEAVESSWPTHLCDKEVNESCIAWKSGTSFATPIAVGIATFLLQYAKENLDAGMVSLLRKPQGMRAVFKVIACKKQGYYYIAPKVHADHLFGRKKDQVRDTISDALRSN